LKECFAFYQEIFCKIVTFKLLEKQWIEFQTILKRREVLWFSVLKSSIINKRIIQQLQELKQYPKNILIVEGISNEDIYSGIIHENALRGFLLSVALEFQVPLIFTQNEKDTARYLSVLAKKSPKKDFSLRATKLFKSKEERLQFILEGFPNIGPVTAKKLISQFKTLRSIINASEEELKPILGSRTKDFLDLLN